MTFYRSDEVLDQITTRRAAEAEWARLKAAAQNFWVQHDDIRSVSVGVMFKGRVPREHAAFIQEVAAFVRQHLNQLRRANDDFFPDASSPLTQQYLDRIVLRADAYAEWYSNFSGGYVALPDASNIPGIVKVKSNKQFRSTDELWLVIHCGTHISEMTLELDGVEDFRPIEGLDLARFERVFVLTYSGTYEWAKATNDWRQL